MLVFTPHLGNYPVPLNTFHKEVFEFCKQWNLGKKEFLFQTSGSTGIPKPIYLSRKSMTESALLTKEWLDLREGDHALLCLPIQYIAGAMMLVRAIVLKLNIVLIEPSQNPLESIIKPINIHLASFVTTQWSTILESKFDLFSIFSDAKGILIGGSELSTSLNQLTQNIELPIFQTYGMTETSSHIAFRRLISVNSEIYQCLPFVNIQINDQGCLRINSPSTLNKWIDTHDLVDLINTHQFKILGRSDFIINSGGRKINPATIEKRCQLFFNEHSLNDKLFAWGLDDDFYGQKLVLLIETSNEFHLKSELINYLKQHLESWEVPKQLLFMSNFIYTPTGKIDRSNTLTLYFNNLKPL